MMERNVKITGAFVCMLLIATTILPVTNVSTVSEYCNEMKDINNSTNSSGNIEMQQETKLRGIKNKITFTEDLKVEDSKTGKEEMTIQQNVFIKCHCPSNDCYLWVQNVYRLWRYTDPGSGQTHWVGKQKAGFWWVTKIGGEKYLKRSDPGKTFATNWEDHGTTMKNQNIELDTFIKKNGDKIQILVSGPQAGGGAVIGDCSDFCGGGCCDAEIINTETDNDVKAYFKNVICDGKKGNIFPSSYTKPEIALVGTADGSKAIFKEGTEGEITSEVSTHKLDEKPVYKAAKNKKVIPESATPEASKKQTLESSENLDYDDEGTSANPCTRKFKYDDDKNEQGISYNYSSVELSILCPVERMVYLTIFPLMPFPSDYYPEIHISVLLGPILVRAEVESELADIGRVGFCVDGGTIHWDNRPPYIYFWWPPFGVGLHTIQAVGCDEAGFICTKSVEVVSVWFLPGGEYGPG